MASLPFKVLLAIATLATATPQISVAQDLDIYIGGGGSGPRYYDQDGPRYYDDDPRYDDYRPRRDYGRRPERYQCTTRQALSIAQRYLRNVRLGRTSNDAIEVRGIGRRGERNRVIFGTEPGCPRIG